MKKTIFGTPVVVSAVLLMVFAAAFAGYNTTRQGSSSASSVGCAVGGETVRLFFQDNPANATKETRMLVESPASYLKKTYTLPNGATITPGKYEVRTIASDNHYTHRSSAPDKDIDPQTHEQYYLEIDGQRTPAYSTDFTDFYDWRGGDGELIQDDDNNIDSIPSVVRNQWNGEYLGTVDVTNAASVVTAHHRSAFEAESFRTYPFDSIIPSAIILNCVNPGTPVLEIMTNVDGNLDGTFDPVLEATQQGDTVEWQVIGKNVGDADDGAAKIRTCAPAGTTLVAGSSAIRSGGGSVTEVGNCIEWEGPLAQAGSVDITFKTVVANFAACDAVDTVNSRCSLDAAIYSSATETTLASPADTDDAAVEIGVPTVTVDKTVDGNNDGTFSESEQITPGEEFTWKLSVVNTGQYPANKILIKDTAAPGVIFNSIQLEGGTATAITGNVISLPESIAVGQTKTFLVKAVVQNSAAFNQCDSDANGTCANVATIEIDTGTGFEEVDKDQAVVTVPAASLSINKTVDGIDDDEGASDRYSELETVRVGESFEWKITVANPGKVDAVNFRVVDTRSLSKSTEDYEFTDAKILYSTDGASATFAGNGIDGEGNFSTDVTVPAGGVVEILLSAIMKSNDGFSICDTAAGEAGQCQNTVQLYQVDGDGNLIDADESQDGVQPYGSDDAAVLLEKDPILSVAKLVDGNDDGVFSEIEAIEQGKPFKWKIVTSNAADAGLAESVIIDDQLPAGVVFSPAPPASGGVVRTENKATKIGGFWGATSYSWTGDIQPGGSVELIMTTTVNDAAAFIGCDNAPYEGNQVGDGKCHNQVRVGFVDDPANDISLPNTNDAVVAEDGADVTMVLQSALSVKKQVDGSDDDNDQPGRFSDTAVEEILAGVPFTWQITAQNTGTISEPNAAILDTLPNGVELVADSLTYSVDGVDSVGTITIVGKTILWSGELERNSSLLIEFDTTIANFEAFGQCLGGITGSDSCQNIALVGTNESGSDPDTFVSVARDPAYVTVVRNPVLTITKTVDGDVDDDSTFREYTKREAVKAEDSEVSWQIIGCNTGNANEPLATIYPWRAVEGLKDAISYVAGSARVVTGPEGGVLTEVDGQFVWQGELEAGEGQGPKTCVVIHYETQIVDKDAFTACDTVDGVEDDENCTLNAVIGIEDSANDGAFEQAAADDAAIYVEPSGLLTVKKTVDGDRDGTFSEQEEIEPGVEYDYRVVVTNEGDAAVENAAMYDRLPKGVTSVGDAMLEPVGFGAVSVITGDRFLVLWTVDSLDPGKSVEITFPVVVSSTDAFTNCDDDDGNQNDICTNNAAAGTATNQDDWKGLTENDKADVVLKKKPVLYLDKLVDGIDADTEFNKEEQIAADGTEFTYLVKFGNTGDADAPDSRVMTGIMPGLQYVSHATSPDNVGDFTYDEAKGSLVWVGDLPVGAAYELRFVVKTNSLTDYQKCDVVDGVEDLRCDCGAVLTFEDTRLISNAIVNTEVPEEPTVTIDKLVDGNGDGEFGENEEIAIGNEITWRVDATNRGAVDAEGITITDSLIDGMKYVQGSLREVSGAEFGVVNVVNDDVIWQGDIPAGVTISFEFKVVFTSLQGFQQCNNSDGNAADELCTNPVVVTKTDTGRVLGTDDANVNTPLPRVLAYTGTATVNYIVVVGVVIAAITIATAVIAYVTRPRSGSDMGGRQGPTVTIVPSA